MKSPDLNGKFLGCKGEKGLAVEKQEKSREGAYIPREILSLAEKGRVKA